jgi:uncharacterized protein with FMN-binding domain
MVLILVLLSTCVNFDSIIITNPDLQSIADGTYQGTSKVGPVRVTLDVEIKSRTISTIHLIRHFNGRGKAAEAIIPQIIEAQSLDIDVISGATGSSKAILKAVEDALK